MIGGRVRKSSLFKGETQFTLSKETINNILKLFGNLKLKNFLKNSQEILLKNLLIKLFFINKYLNIKNDQTIFYEI